MRSKTKGVLFLVFPFVFLPVVLSLYAILRFVFAAVADNGGGLAVFGVLNMVLGLLGILGVLSFFVFIPLGIYFLARKDTEVAQKMRFLPAYQNFSDEDLDYALGWSWGIFLFAPIWALINRMWLWFVVLFVPFVSVIFWIYMLVVGKQKAWEKAFLKQTNFDVFRSRQRLSVIVGLIVTVVFIILSIVLQSVFINSFDGKNSRNNSKFEYNSLESLGIDDSENTLDFSDVVKEVDLFAENSIDKDLSIDCLFSKDTDGDLVNDRLEQSIGLAFDKSDTDGDGFDDLEELLKGYDPVDSFDDFFEAGLELDTDEDGIRDVLEKNFYKTNFMKADSDKDGVNDLEEIKTGNNPSGDGALRDWKTEFQEDADEWDKNCK